jgi:pilus assembly protein CpaB
MSPAPPLHHRLLRLLGRARRRVLLHRRPLAALAAAGAVAAGLHAVSPPPPPTVPVLTAAEDLPAGTRLRPADLVRTDLPAEVVPDGSLDHVPRDRTLASPMTRGEVLTVARTLTPGLVARYPGSTAVPVRVADAAVVGLLRVGDPLTLVLADPDGRTTPAVLAADVPVVALPQEPRAAVAPSQQGRLVVVAIPDADAADVAARAAQGYLAVIWRR